ncbi:hypothetical protein P154DRAFT_539110 [Amniculicola lignicola CBS 123094]|uniref:Uncharacterized protein n=1 Tax=Amniculicola lignicola CBS 123094 TaxID=1392246 RepID=A0A6A5W7C1_9PLEO|nr:hypothetical protein P154DRAFT_539110 [Amniculicola lignicola CBS 123094]
MEDVKGILCLLFNKPDLCRKIKTLEVKLLDYSREYCYMKEPTELGQFLQNCVQTVNSLPIQSPAKELWIAELRAHKRSATELFLTLLFAMLPNLEELYLGECSASTIGLEECMTAASRAVVLERWEIFGRRLKTVEFPVTIPANRICKLVSTPQRFPNLRHLFVPFSAIEGGTFDIAQGCLPTSLELLTIIDGGLDSHWGKQFLDDIILNRHAHFPNLRAIFDYNIGGYLYFRRSGRTSYVEDLAALGIVLSPKNATINCSYLYPDEARAFIRHPWRFSEKEIEEIDNALWDSKARFDAHRRASYYSGVALNVKRRD